MMCNVHILWVSPNAFSSAVVLPQALRLEREEEEEEEVNKGEVMKVADHPVRMIENSLGMERSTAVDSLRDTCIFPIPLSSSSSLVVILPPSTTRSSWSHNNWNSCRNNNTLYNYCIYFVCVCVCSVCVCVCDGGSHCHSTSSYSPSPLHSGNSVAHWS